MIRTSIKNSTVLIENREDFDAGTLTGKWETLISWGRVIEAEDFFYYALSRGLRETVLRDHSRLYVIYSYQTPIAFYDPNYGWFISERTYSVTTARHITTVKRAIS